jgi:SAM-dependent methyltransferase/predicted transcriptional regulator
MEKKDDIMAIARAFMRSRIILTAADLDLFTMLDDGYCTVERIAGKSGLSPRPLARVLDCLVTFGFLDKKENTYSLTEEGASLSSRHPTSSLPMILHMSQLWDSWSGLTKIVEKGSATEKKLPKVMDDESRRAFIGAMHVIGRTLSEDIAGSLDLSGFKKLLDIGGGSGTYTIAFLKHNPELEAVLFDMENVILMARERLESEGFLDRASLVSGDFYRDELPRGCDLVLLSAIIHQNSPDENRDLYRKIFRAVEPGGMLIVRDHIMNESRTWPPEGALFAINMLVNTRGGDTYTFGEVEKTLEDAGFVDIRIVRTGERMDCLVVAVKPK